MKVKQGKNKEGDEEAKTVGVAILDKKVREVLSREVTFEGRSYRRERLSHT